MFSTLSFGRFQSASNSFSGYSSPVQLLLVERLAVLTRHPHPPAAGADFVAHSCGHPTRRQDHQVRDLNRHLARGNAALDLLLRIRTRMTLGDGDPFDGDLAREVVHLEHASRLSLIAPGDHLHHIVLLDLHPDRLQLALLLPALIRYLRHLDNLRREGNDLHKTLVAQPASHRPEHARADRFANVRDQHRGVRVEANVGAVLAARFLTHPYDHAAHHLSLLDGRFRSRFFHAGRDDVAQTRAQAEVAAARQNALKFARAAVIGHLQDCPHSNHDVSPKSSPEDSMLKTLAWLASLSSSLPACPRSRPMPDARHSPARRAGSLRRAPS